MVVFRVACPGCRSRPPTPHRHETGIHLLAGGATAPRFTIHFTAPPATGTVGVEAYLESTSLDTHPGNNAYGTGNPLIVNEDVDETREFFRFGIVPQGQNFGGGGWSDSTEEFRQSSQKTSNRHPPPAVSEG